MSSDPFSSSSPGGPSWGPPSPAATPSAWGLFRLARRRWLPRRRIMVLLALIVALFATWTPMRIDSNAILPQAWAFVWLFLLGDPSPTVPFSESAMTLISVFNFLILATFLIGAALLLGPKPSIKATLVYLVGAGLFITFMTGRFWWFAIVALVFGWLSIVWVSLGGGRPE